MCARVAALAAIALGVSGCLGDSTADNPPSADRVDAVLYTIGISTDPYGVSRPSGFGVASGLARGELRKAEVRTRRYGWFSGAEWLDRGRILVHRRAPPMRRPALYRVVDGKLEPAGLAPFVSGSAYAWSPDYQRLAIEPPAPCEPRKPPSQMIGRSSLWRRSQNPISSESSSVVATVRSVLESNQTCL
jgi:hypothetical protein